MLAMEKLLKVVGDKFSTWWQKLSCSWSYDGIEYLEGLIRACHAWETVLESFGQSYYTDMTCVKIAAAGMSLAFSGDCLPEDCRVRAYDRSTYHASRDACSSSDFALMIILPLSIAMRINTILVNSTGCSLACMSSPSNVQAQNACALRPFLSH